VTTRCLKASTLTRRLAVCITLEQFAALQIKAEQQAKSGDIKAKEGELADAKSQLEPLQVSVMSVTPSVPMQSSPVSLVLACRIRLQHCSALSSAISPSFAVVLGAYSLDRPLLPRNWPCQVLIRY
jgi:hypothetical protein